MQFILLFILGCVLASTIVCLNYRSDHALSYFHPRSFCEACYTSLKWWQLLPILGYLFQKGRCHFCNQQISRQSTVLEFSFALVLVIFGYLLPPSAWINFTCGCAWLLYLSLQDIKHHKVSTVLVFIGGMIFLLSAHPQLNHLDQLVALSFLGILFLENLRHKLGSGDTFVIMFLWLALGNTQALLMLFSASSLALGYYLLFAKKEALPFIPFIFSGYLLSYLF